MQVITAANKTVEALTKLVDTQRPVPKRAGVIAQIWDTLDSQTEVVTSKTLPAIAEESGFSLTTLRIQFYAWRAHRAHGETRSIAA